MVQDKPFTISFKKIEYNNVDSLYIDFIIAYKPHNDHPELAVSNIYIIDKLGREYSSLLKNDLLEPSHLRKNVSITMELPPKSVLIRHSLLIIKIIAKDTVYKMKYLIEADKRATFDGSEVYSSSPDDMELFNSIKQRFQEKPELNRSIGASSVISKQSEDIREEGYRSSTLEQYRKALVREMMYIRNEGGRQYKVSNGQLVSSKQGAFTYGFDLDSEIHLSDDAPVSLTTTGNVTASGNVLICEGFQILLVLDKDLGHKVISAHIKIEPWKLLEAMINKLDEIDEDDRIAIKLINEGPRLSKGDINKIQKGQEAAISSAESNDITLIWGPPGTGKTYTMAQIAINALNNSKRVLIVSHSNISVDGVIKQIVSQLTEAGNTSLLENGKVLRYGYVRDTELAANESAVSFNYALSKHPHIKTRIDELKKEKQKISNIVSPEGNKVEQELKQLRSSIRSIEGEYVTRANIVATTVSKLTVDSIFADEKYDLVMFDEVSMAYVPQLIIAASFSVDHFVAVGDFRQLPPIVQSDDHSILGKDIFQFLGITGIQGSLTAHPWLVMLDEQRRMHPDISAFSSSYVYSNLLKDHNSVEKTRRQIALKAPFPGKAMTFIDLTGTYCAAGKNSDNSRFNILSAVFSFASALSSEKSGEESVAIISPYAAQTRLIRAMIQDYKKKKNTTITCATVHQFQGSEKNTVVFDAVESYPGTRTGFLMGKNLSTVMRLINVAITRARGKFILIGNSKFWTRRFEGSSHLLYKLIVYMDKKGYSIRNKKDHSMCDLLQDLVTGDNITVFSSPNDALGAFETDIRSAKHFVSLSIPDGELDEDTGNPILKLLYESKLAGINIYAKSRGLDDLSEYWQDFTHKSDDAVFPLIEVDDDVIWFGLPLSSGRFTDGDWMYKTVCPIVMRITGENTLEMIRSLTDLHQLSVSGKSLPYTEKIGHAKNNESSVNNIGLEKESSLKEYVRSKVACKKCHSPMSLSKGRSGKPFLRCSSCGSTDLLTVDTVNDYIDAFNIVCPEHRCLLYCGLSPHGLYLRCPEGQHFLKLDEI